MYKSEAKFLLPRRCLGALPSEVQELPSYSIAYESSTTLSLPLSSLKRNKSSLRSAKGVQDKYVGSKQEECQKIKQTSERRM